MEIVLGVTIVCLIGLNIYQGWFFSNQIQTLVDKVMSRDFAEYNLIKEGPQEKILKSHDEYEEDIEERDILKELNGMIGA